MGVTGSATLASLNATTDSAVDNPTVSYQVQYLFQRNFGADGACDDILFDLYDREEFSAPVTVGFSPPRPGAKANTLCWEANVLTFANSGLLGSKNQSNIPTTFQNGWLNLGFPTTTANAQAHILQNVGSTTVTTITVAGSLPSTANRCFRAGSTLTRARPLTR